MQDELLRLKSLQARRKTAIVIQSKIWRTIEAYVRVNVIGFSTFDDEATRAKACKQAEKIIKAAKQGKGDADVVELVVSSIKAAEPFDAMRNGVEREMRKIARASPLWLWAADVRGLGDLGLAVILAEAGDPGKYGNVGKMWKRLGLAPIMKGDKTQAGKTWRIKGGLSADDWTAAGYNPKRRAEIYSCIDEPLFRAQSQSLDKGTGEITRQAGPFRRVYDARRARTAETHPEWSKAHSHGDALRIMTKALISDLWSEWRRASNCAPEGAVNVMPASEQSAQAGDRLHGPCKSQQAHADPEIPSQDGASGADRRMPERANPAAPHSQQLEAP